MKHRSTFACRSMMFHLRRSGTTQAHDGYSTVTAGDYQVITRVPRRFSGRGAQARRLSTSKRARPTLITPSSVRLDSDARSACSPKRAPGPSIVRVTMSPLGVDVRMFRPDRTAVHPSPSVSSGSTASIRVLSARTGGRSTRMAQGEAHRRHRHYRHKLNRGRRSPLAKHGERPGHQWSSHRRSPVIALHQGLQGVGDGSGFGALDQLGVLAEHAAGVARGDGRP